MTYDLIIFDYDGVVADSEVLNSTVMAEQLTAIGLPTSLDDVLASYTGKRWRDNRPVVEAALGGPCPDDFHTNWFATCRARARRVPPGLSGADARSDGAGRGWVRLCAREW